jgi:hypothetical protein
MIDWAPNKINRLSELVNDPEQYSESTIAKIMSDEFSENFSRDAIHNKIHRLENQNTLLEKPRPEMPYFSKYESIIRGDSLPKVFEMEGSYVELMKDHLKILHLGDPHIPFQIDEQIQTAVNRNKAADLAVTVEVADCYSISRFNKNLSIPLEIEIDYVLRYFEFLNETFPLTLVLAGNHQKRIGKEMMKQLHPSLLFLVDGDLMHKLAKPFEKIVVCKTPILQINDTIFTHAEVFSKVDLKASVNVYQIIQEWKDVLGLRDYHCIIQSHTYMLGTTYRGGHCKIMESGCLCTVPDYAVQNFYSKPQTNGYIVVIQKDGITDMNLTREYTFGSPIYEANRNPIGGYYLGL